MRQKITLNGNSSEFKRKQTICIIKASTSEWMAVNYMNNLDYHSSILIIDDFI